MNCIFCTVDNVTFQPSTRKHNEHNNNNSSVEKTAIENIKY